VESGREWEEGKEREDRGRKGLSEGEKERGKDGGRERERAGRGE
jgi:hypothetical protein